MSDDHEDAVESPDIHFEPIINLPPVETKTLEEDEEELLQLRAKLFRYDNFSEPPEWKERGTGDMKLLRHRKLGTCRLLMRRDKTLKICANHYILPLMELKPNCGSDRAWVWSAMADYADEQPKPELLAARFANAESAVLFQQKFEEAKKIMERLSSVEKSEEKVDRREVDKETDKLTAKLDTLNVVEKSNQSTGKGEEKATEEGEKSSDKTSTEVAESKGETSTTAKEGESSS